MANAGSAAIDFTVTNQPPSGKVQNIRSNGFKNRRKMFSCSQERMEEKTLQFPNTETKSNGCKNELIHEQNHQRKTHSAKARLERHFKNKQFADNFEKGSSSIIDLNSVSEVPDFEEQMLINITNKRIGGSQPQSEFLTSLAIRPSSAKGRLDSSVVKVNESKSNLNNTTQGIKPSVYGLQVGRQVFGAVENVSEAWKETEKEFPYKLSNKNNISNEKSSTCNTFIPSTLKPLAPWMQINVPTNIIGLDSSLCLVFLSDDYQNSNLPEVPPPQDALEDLPYKCVVETPREPIVRKYKHPSIEKDDPHDEWKCRHSGLNGGTTYQGDISNLMNKPYWRSPDKIRKEIQELEDLMRGIGDLASNCSFVQFQAEITQAKELAAKLSKLRPLENNEPTDTFGLLKLYKENEVIMAALHQRRNDCIQELAAIENDL